MTITSNLALPYLEAGQAQKHVTHNEALRMLDALVMLTVQDRDLSAPPPAPVDGARYIVKAPGTGIFAGKDAQIAHYADGGWLFYPPMAGWTCFVADESALLAFDGGEWVAATDTIGGAGRELLTAGRTYYVRTDGSDSNSGLANNAGGAFLTIQKAVDAVAALDLSVHDVTIQVENGTYATPVVLKSTVGAGKITIRGDTTTPANVIINTTGATAISGSGYAGRYRLEGVKLQTSTSGHTIHIAGAKLEIGQIDFGVVAGGYNHIMLEAQAYLLVVSAYAISGGAGIHWAIRSGSYLDCRSLTITLSGTPGLSIFAYADLVAILMVASNTFTGSATGQRYNIGSNSILFTGGVGATYLPGSSSGSSATGAQYL